MEGLPTALQNVASNGLSGDKDEGNDEAVEGECFSEDEDEDESHKYSLLQGVGANSYFSHLSDGESCGLNGGSITTQLNPQTRPEAMCE
ncbi:unnamed protein product [Sphagnum balticum]